MLDIYKTIASVETKAKRKKTTIQRLCALAGISQSTWTRAKHGKQEIKVSTLQKMVDAVGSL